MTAPANKNDFSTDLFPGFSRESNCMSLWCDYDIQPMTLEEAFEEIFDHEDCVAVWRLDFENGSPVAIEDITKGFCQAFVEYHGANHRQTWTPCNPVPHKLIAESDAWDRYVNDPTWSEESDYDHHNTLNHRQQGIRRRA